MCGIAGFTRFHNRIGDESTLEQMGDVIRHRGPDAGGIYLDDRAGLSHRRLSIIDLSASGNQPMFSHDDRYVIAFNGEIYNFLELRDELEQQGYPFKTHTDTEVILALYASIGTECLQKINGMFAFALWDKVQNSLLIARDRIGKKPLYYYPVTDADSIQRDVIFASELKSILQLDEVPRDIRIDALYDFFAYQYVPDPKTIFEGIFKLDPGHYMTVDANGIKIDKYWELSFNKTSSQPEKALREELREHIARCTKSRMISDVPLGAFLSGGVDSSGIVATMANNSDKPVTTCSIGFDSEQFNETEFAKIVAEQYQTNHHELTVHQHVNEMLEKIAWYFDEPFADPSLVPTYFVSQLAREKVTVAIAGDGGDEVFAGYEKYSIDHAENRLRKLFPSAIRKALFPTLAKLTAGINTTLTKKATTLLKSLSQEPAMGFYMSNAQITDEEWNQLITPETSQQLGNYHPSHITVGYYNECDSDSHLSRILFTDMKTYLPGDILVKVDRMSMANSLEVRAPILDYTLIEFANSIPPEYKFRDGEKKYILKEAFKQDLPDDILYRRKMGFSVPLADWFRGEIKDLSKKALFSSTGGLRDYFNMQGIEDLWIEHQDDVKDHSTVLWSLLMFQLWWNHYMQKIT